MADPRIRQVRRVGLRLLDLLGEQRLVDGAVVHVSQRHPSAGQHAVQLDDPPDQIRVGLLPERFFALPEELIQEGRRPCTRASTNRARWHSRDSTSAGRQGTQLDVVVGAAQLGEHPADVVANIALHFKDERGGAPLGIRPLASSKSWRANGCIHADVLPDPTAPRIATPV